MAGYDNAAKRWYEKRANGGNSPLHNDHDAEYKFGLPTVYFCFILETLRSGRTKRPLPTNDLVSFPAPDGDRGIRIETMNPDYVCVVFNRSRNLHGNVFPDKLAKDLSKSDFAEEGCIGLRAVCYSTKQVQNFIERVNKDQQNYNAAIDGWCSNWYRNKNMGRDKSADSHLRPGLATHR